MKMSMFNFLQYIFEECTGKQKRLWLDKVGSGFRKQIHAHLENLRGTEKLLNTDLLFALLEAQSLMVSLRYNSCNKDPPNPI